MEIIKLFIKKYETKTELLTKNMVLIIHNFLMQQFKVNLAWIIFLMHIMEINVKMFSIYIY